LKNLRIIARLDIKGQNLIKGIQLEGLRKLGNPFDYAKKYFDSGIDEIIYLDTVASLYQRDSLMNIIKDTTNNIFIPFTVCGGIRSENDVEKILYSGADKIGINSAAIKEPDILNKVAKKFGSQCVTLSIEAKRNEIGWEALFNSGREKSGLDVLEWIRKAEDLGAGEILLTSVDKDGARKGFDLDLAEETSNITKIPIILSGGLGNIKHLKKLFERADPDAIAIASAFHYDDLSIDQVKKFCINSNKNIRNI
tara:strand:+ start:1075 stop:1833 length:759 start_codon:yes stop_codon:yes gene_type:complete